MKSFFPLFLILGGLLAGYGALALSEADIVFPIAELGNCESEQECKAYCDNPVHFDACISFVEEYNLISPGELAKAKQFRQFEDEIREGPGGCTSQVGCESYCNDVSHIEECLAFAEQHGLMDKEHLKEARMIAKALREGAQLPGGCTNEAQCETYCEDPNHMAECIEFAEAAGFMSPRELKEAKQMLKALDAGVRPPNCRGKKQCDTYCDTPEHMEECVEFGIAAGFIPPEEAEQVRRILPLMKAGKMPGECQKGKEECEAYCSKDENIEECTTFFVEAGFMTPEDAVMFKKTGGKGPGDCKGKEECEAYCNEPANQKVCFEFARKHGLIPEEDLRRMEEGIGKFKEWFSSAPPEVAQCLKGKVGEDVLQKIHDGAFMPNPELIGSLEQCFEEFMPRPEPGEFGPSEEFFEQKNPEQVRCIERILGSLDAPRTQELEQRIARECFGGGEDFGPPPGSFEQFVPEEYREFIPENAENLTPEEIERIIREKAEQQMRQQMQEQFGPVQQGPGPGSLEQGFQELKSLLPQQELLGPPENFKEQPLPQEFIPPAEQVPQETPEIQGNILKAAGGLLRQLFFGR